MVSAGASHSHFLKVKNKKKLKKYVYPVPVLVPGKSKRYRYPGTGTVLLSLTNTIDCLAPSTSCTIISTSMCTTCAMYSAQKIDRQLPTLCRNYDEIPNEDAIVHTLRRNSNTTVHVGRLVPYLRQSTPWGFLN